MKDIKFRYICIRPNGHVVIKIFTLYEIANGALTVWLQANIIRLSDLKVSQFTGLADKYGIDIYADDILENKKSGKGNFFVKMNVGSYNAVYKGNFTLSLYPVLQERDGAIIIGNIYQNPELL